MDSIKPYLLAMKRNQFWILSAIAVVTALVVWNSASGDVGDKFTKDKGTNDRAFMSLGMFNNRQMNKLPNAEYKKRVDADREKLEVGVLDAWKLLFSRQIKVFPVNKNVEGLEKYLTDEKFVDLPIPVEIREKYRDRDLLLEDFRNLFDKLNLRRPQGINPVEEVRDEVVRPPEGLVVWAAKPSPRELMLRYKVGAVPTTERLRMLHEDMWVFRSMFTVIEEINKKPLDVWLDILNGKAPSDLPVDQANVPIKQINYLDLAQYAMTAAEGNPGSVEMKGDEAAPAGARRAEGGGNAGQSSFSVGVTGLPAEDEKIRKGRYIDGRNMPVDDPAAPPFKEFKQMFVQMEFVMDQRLIPVLIAECSNAPIIIETRQVLVDLNEVDIPKVVNAAEAARVVNRIEQSPHDVIVTLRGVVYGYSPPKKENLGTGTDPDPSKRDYGVPKKLPTEL